MPSYTRARIAGTPAAGFTCDGQPIVSTIASLKVRRKYNGKHDQCRCAPSILGTEPIEAAAPETRECNGVLLPVSGNTILL